MASLEKINKSFRRIHKERSQPEKRSNYGILPKKADYKKRAQSHANKQRLLKSFREKAYNKNWDEFYYNMISFKPDPFGLAKQPDNASSLNVNDINFIRYKRSINLQKINRLKHLSDLHPIPTHIIFEDSDHKTTPGVAPNIRSNIGLDTKAQKKLVKRLDRETNLRSLQEKIDKKLDKSKTYTVRDKNGQMIKVPERKS